MTTRQLLRTPFPTRGVIQMNKSIFKEVTNQIEPANIPPDFIRIYEEALLKALMELGLLDEVQYAECIRRL